MPGHLHQNYFFFMGMLQRNVFLTPAVLLLFQWCVTVAQLLVNAMVCLLLELPPQNSAHAFHFSFPAGLTAHFTAFLFSCSRSIHWERPFCCRSSSYFVLNCLQLSVCAEDFFSLLSSTFGVEVFAAVESQTGDGFWLAAANVAFFLVLDAFIILCLSVLLSLTGFLHWR